MIKNYIEATFALLCIILFFSCAEKEIVVECDLFLYNKEKQLESLSFIDEDGNSKMIEKKIEISSVNNTFVNVFGLLGNGPREIQVKAGDVFLSKNKGFRIALIDYNANFVFNDIDEDFIWVGGFEDSISIWDINPLLDTLTEKMVFSFNDLVYQIESIDKQGKNIVLKSIQEKSLIPKITYNTKIPESKVIDITGDYTSIRDLHEYGRALFIDTWFQGCTGCVKILPLLDSLNEFHSNDIKIVGLNTVDDEVTIKNYIRNYNILWQQIKGNQTTIKNLGILNYSPNGVLYDKDGKLINLNAKIEDVFAYLKYEGIR